MKGRLTPLEIKIEKKIQEKKEKIDEKIEKEKENHAEIIRKKKEIKILDKFMTFQ